MNAEGSTAPTTGRLDSGPPKYSRGLPSIDQVRREGSRLRWMPPKFWLWIAVVLAASFVYWWMKERSAIQSMRSEVLARQRAVVAELGPRWLPLRDKAERWTTECASSKDELVLKADLARWDFRGMPGIYLRLVSTQAQSPERIREAAKTSLHDGFTACLLRAPNPSPLLGPACKTARDCPVGEHCNEFERCAKHAQPYNMRLAYRTMRLLNEEWVREVESTTDRLEMRGAKATFEDVNHYDIPVAVELLTRAKYFLVVVDDAKKAPSTDLATPHEARVCVWRLADDERLMALTRVAAGTLRGGSASSRDAQTNKALAEQANSCALAMAVREAMGDESAAEVIDHVRPDRPADVRRDGGADGGRP